MAYWVHGRDAKTGRPDSMLSTANTEEEARQQAAAQGLIAETVQLEIIAHTEKLPLPLAGTPVASRFRFKLIGFVLFILGYLVVGFFWVKQLKNSMSGYFHETSIYLFFASFCTWAFGCLFQSRTWKEFKFGCLVGVLMFFAVMIPLTISVVINSH